MSQIDFRPLFSSSDPGPLLTDDRPDKDFVPSRGPNLLLPRILQLGRSEWTNIGFVSASVVGALVCAFYFFPGAELVRSALAWPGELLYRRPLLLPQHAKSQAALASSALTESSSAANHANDESGDPFARTARLLKFDSLAPDFAASLRGQENQVEKPFTSDSLLNQLNLRPGTGGDRLETGLSESPAEISSTTSAVSSRASTASAATMRTSLAETKKASTQIRSATKTSIQGRKKDVNARSLIQRSSIHTAKTNKTISEKPGADMAAQVNNIDRSAGAANFVRPVPLSPGLNLNSQARAISPIGAGFASGPRGR